MLAKTQAADPYRVLILPHTRRDGDVTCALFERSGLTCQVLERAAKLATEIERAVGAVVLTDAAFTDRDIERFLVVLERKPARRAQERDTLEPADIGADASELSAGGASRPGPAIPDPRPDAAATR